MRKYPTSLEHDKKLLEEDDKIVDPVNKLSLNVRHCIMFRKGEKEVCQHLLDCANIVKIIRHNPASRAREVIKFWAGRRFGKEYFRKTFIPFLFQDVEYNASDDDTAEEVE